MEIGLQDLPAPLIDLPLTSTGSLFHVGMTMADLERGAILQTLQSADGNRTKASAILGISLRTLQRKLKEYGVS